MNLFKNSWDLLDQTHAPVIANCPITPVAITSMVFSPNSSFSCLFLAFDTNVIVQQIAVGDEDGNLRILEVPLNFVIPLNNEKHLVEVFYKKEKEKQDFIIKRNKIQNISKMKQLLQEKKNEENEDNDNGKKKKSHIKNYLKQCAQSLILIHWNIEILYSMHIALIVTTLVNKLFEYFISVVSFIYSDFLLLNFFDGNVASEVHIITSSFKNIYIILLQKLIILFLSLNFKTTIFLHFKKNLNFIWKIIVKKTNADTNIATIKKN
ncbi:flagellar inner dynein arm I1 intermediate chain [Reticulomyxa filosa]|uniref:Flagellar inner dynein arm I1 intermediate chain n=1 Tax=Reticulomyxa filosa TaxID=46433 RepID=X6NX11_RETFI|nr:flagellar inner dynein arm I1 intermediate chain [Reticulomyxa filosa]|eukprot:ETO30536.1 flagellar inner dynein arm I1 intermediate chain [Reticulomyxa filosa]